MLILLWLALSFVFVLCGLFLLVALVKAIRLDDKKTFFHAFKDALRECGFRWRQGYSLELYKWVPDDSEEICEESAERAQWPAMDIADWMKAGLPQDENGHSMCGQDCSCRLVLYKKTRLPASPSQ